ncbi:MAG: SDR family oxidoreductase [Phycisphaerales bacterium]|nr:SDR family oxidoreductase [Phycisphaerales bacterium]
MSTTRNHRLVGRVALVTGGAGGIGQAVVRRLRDEGADVLLTDVRDEAGREAASTIGTGVSYRRLDVRDESDWQAAFDHVIETRARLDIVVNNAGITGFDGAAPTPHDPEHASLDAWRDVHRTNLDGVFLGCRHAIRTMRAVATPSGSIVNIGSRSGVVGIPGAAAYASSKGAVRNHTRSVALYCADQGLPIRCNVVQPAAILTPMWEPLLGDGPDREERMRAFVADCPLQRFGTPDEVASIVAWLASDEAAYVTGAEFNIDGGMLAGTAQRPAPRS